MNTLLPKSVLWREATIRFPAGSAIAIEGEEYRDLTVSVQYGASSCKIPVSREQLAWSLDDITEKLFRPHMSGMLEGAT